MPSDYSKIKEDNIKEYGEGTRHLAFLGRLYTDRTHFIFELLQNAEDAGACKVLFRLFDDRLEVAHDGRPFNEQDVRGICGVGEGTKAEDLTQIGKFGIGFKSVYSYTSTPEIYSGDESFGIKNYVRPYPVEYRDIEDSWTTLFVFKFNAEGIDPKTACQEIGKCLRNLSARTLLFLRKIEEIEYQLPDENGVYLREEISGSHARQVAVIGQNSGQDEDENWLIFERPVRVPDKSYAVRVEVGFQLETDAKGEKKSIKKINDAPLVVYFPTEKATRLGFLIQGPYRTTPPRDNIPKDNEWNKTLIKETAELVVESLQRLKEMGLLSVSLLETLPIQTDDFQEGSMFYPIFSRVKESLLSEKLLPADDGTFVAASNAKLARGTDLMRLLDQNHLPASFQSDAEIRWLTGGITQDRTPDLRSYLVNELDIGEVTPETFARNLSEAFLVEQKDEWFIRFYRFLSEQKALWRRPRWSGDRSGILRNKPILRLQNGSHVAPFLPDNSPNAYLAANTETSLPIVKVTLSSDEEVRKFLQELGVPNLDIVEEVIEKILPKYMDGSVTVDPEGNERDLKKIERAYKTDSQRKKTRLQDKLEKTPFILTENPSGGGATYRKPDEVYFGSDELRIYFSDNNDIAFVSSEYPDSVVSLLKKLEVSDKIRIRCKSKPGSTSDVYLSWEGGHRRGLGGFDPDICVDGLENALMNPSIEKSRIIWNAIAANYGHCIKGIVLISSRQDFSPDATTYKREKKTSLFGALLMSRAWLPGSDGNLHKPRELTLDDLPESFVRDEKLADQLGMKKNVVAKLAEEIGVEAEDIEAIRQNPEEFKQWKETVRKKAKPSFPTRAVNSSERREKRLSEQHNAAPEKEYERRERSVRTTRGMIDPDTWLKNQYTNESDQMICQICKEEMPFKKRNSDEYYFEAVEALSKEHFNKEYEAQFLALCPECAARYKEFVKNDENVMQEVKNKLANSEGLEIPLQLGELDTSIRFVETHLHDLKTIENDILK